MITSMRFTEVVSRISGVSTPIFGLSWTPPTADVTVAAAFIAFVEVRRVLFSTYTNEVPEQCVASVIDIRDHITSLVATGGIGPELAGPLRTARRYCVRFLERVGATEGPSDAAAAQRRLFHDPHWGMHDYWFGEALGELRAGVGMQVAIIAASHGLDVEDDLASVLPEPDETD